MFEFIGIVFARHGSKGLPNKNLLDFNGKPLLAWSIAHLKSCPLIKKIIVSTNSAEIANVALKYGAEVPFLRPDYLASDTSPEWDSWKHAVNELERLGYNFNYLVSAPTTSPLRTSEDVFNGVSKIKQSNNSLDALVSIRNACRHPVFNIVNINNKGLVEIYDKSKSYSRRQDTPLVYDLTTILYIASKQHIKNSDRLLDGNVGFIEVPIERSIDIDSKLDFDIANFLFSRQIDEKKR